MKLLLQEYRRRTLVPFAGAALAVYYILVFVPLEKRDRELEAPLGRAWRQLTISLERTNAVSVDFLRLTNQLQEARQSLAILETAKRKAADRLELSPEVKSRMMGPFQLVDYDYERSKTVDALTALSVKRKITLDPSVYYGFPEHTADVRQPELLWPALSMIEGLLTSALQAGVSTVHTLETPVVLTNPPPRYAALTLDEIPIQVELTGSVASVARLLQSLPMTAQEIRSTGLLESAAEKPPLFIDRFIIKKQTPEKPDEVRLWLRVLGFVLRE